MRGRLARHAALALLGLLGVLWALTLGANPVITCHEVVMRPGDVCANADGTRTQTYQERWDAAQGARPVVGGVGLVVAGFGVALLRAEWRAGRPVPPPQDAASGIGP